ncbi:hypothetical protein ACM1RC_27440 [Paenibacillus azoreducens]|uniref:hypothetical protein n=1 Tax=Paenibacillus azoreducens TaxID=116718 RepID=UPI0039F587AC
MSGKVIQNDEQYEKARVAILDMAAKLDDPLAEMSDAERTRLMAIYDRTTDLMQRYRRGKLVQLDPHLRDIYRQIGYKWQEIDSETERQPEDDQQEPAEKQSPPPEPEEKTPSNPLSDWLED